MYLAAFWHHPSAIAFPFEWELADQEALTEKVELLRQRIPTIRTQYDIPLMIQEISGLIPSSEILAKLQDGKIIFALKAATIVSDIEVRLVTSTFQRDLRQIAGHYENQPASPELEARIIGEIQSFLTTRGFPSAKISIQQEPKSAHAVQYTIRVNENFPCFIAEIQFTNPDAVTKSLPKQDGEICDIALIESVGSKLKTLYDENAFFQSRVSEPVIQYSPDKTQATVIYRNEKGLKIVYQTQVRDENFNLRKFFSEEVVQKDDANSIDPNTMVSELGKRYQNQGFADVQVDRPEIIRNDADTYTYRFPVTLGPRYMMSHIKFEGLNVYSEYDAIAIMGLSGLWQDNSVLIPENINKALDKLRSRYQQDGYWDVKIRYPNIGKDAVNAQATVTFRILEGPQRVLGTLEITGNTGIPTDQLAEALQQEEGKALAQSALLAFEEKLQNIYMEAGYVYARATLEINPIVDRNRSIVVNVKVVIEEYRQTKIGHLTITGLRLTEREVVERELLFHSGDKFDPESIAATRRALLRLGIFRSVAIVPADRNLVDTPVESLDLAIEIVEAEPGSLTFGPGYSWPEGMHYTTEVSYSNLFGQAKKTSARLSLSEQRHQGAISNKTLLGRKFTTGYLHPYIFGIPIDASTTVNHRATIADQNIALWEIQNSGEIELKYQFRQWLYDAYVSLFYGQSFNKEEGIDEDKVYLISTGDSRTGFTGTRFSIDKRNDLTWPSQGYSLETEYKMARYPLGGNIKYDKYEVFFAKFFELTESAALMFGVNVGTYHNIEWNGPSADILPVSDRFTAGGISSVRGFSTGKLGPYIYHPSLTETGEDNLGVFEKKVTGGSQKTILKLEYRYRFLDSWAVSAFMDSGAVFMSRKEISEYDKVFNRIRAQRHPDNPEGVQAASVEENLSYDLRQVLSDPDLLWDKQNTAIGPAVSLLLPIGSMNFACGFPIHIAKSDRCRGDRNYCIQRGSENQEWYSAYSCGLNVGTRF